MSLPGVLSIETHTRFFDDVLSAWFSSPFFGDGAGLSCRIRLVSLDGCLGVGSKLTWI